jgi:hypothetical protein
LKRKKGTDAEWHKGAGDGNFPDQRLRTRRALKAPAPAKGVKSGPKGHALSSRKRAKAPIPEVSKGAVGELPRPAAQDQNFQTASKVSRQTQGDALLKQEGTKALDDTSESRVLVTSFKTSGSGPEEAQYQLPARCQRQTQGRALLKQEETGAR